MIDFTMVIHGKKDIFTDRLDIENKVHQNAIIADN
jgi:hypothetical protein